MLAQVIDMARMVLQRHESKIADAADLLGMADELKQKFSGTPQISSAERGPCPPDF